MKNTAPWVYLIGLPFMVAGLSCSDGAVERVQASGSSPFLVANPMSNLTQMYQVLTAAGGGVIYLTSPGSYPCPGAPPSNVSLVSLAPSASANVAMLGFDGVQSGIDTQVRFSNCSQWTLSHTYNTRVEGVALDFANSGAGLSLVNSQWNHWKQVTLENCGNPTTPCVQLLSSGGGTPADNTAFNTFEDMVVNPNTSSGQYATAWLMQGSSSGGGGAVTQNRIIRSTIAGNILCGFDQESLSDSNIISDAQLYQQDNSLSTSSPNCFNLQSPGVDVDADGSIYTNESITGTFAFTARTGQSSGNRITYTDQFVSNFQILGGSNPRLCMDTNTLNGTNGIDAYCDGRLMQAAHLSLPFPSASLPGDIVAAESTTSGKIFLGTSNVSFSTGAGTPSESCTTGSLYTNSAASNAAGVLYVCFGGTWNAMNVR
ncbi:MAG: hypothetical protein ABSF59_22350 [Candidatus Sulfotelmatobacter sp.]|jgi:hypothetical protein